MKLDNLLTGLLAVVAAGALVLLPASSLQAQTPQVEKQCRPGKISQRDA